MTTSDPYKAIGARIQQARLQSGLQQDELAEKLGYRSPATISHFETGNRKVSVIDLQRISAILDIPIDYFFGLTTEKVEPTVSVRYRAKGLLPNRKEQIQSFIKFAESRARYPEGINLITENLDKNGVIGRIAKKYLDQYGSSEPPVDLLAIARQLNVPIFDWRLPNEVSGLTLVIDGQLCIGINDDHPNVRRRFSIAHELGHVILHIAQEQQREAYVNMELNDIEAGKLWAMPEYKDEYREERQANWFAADMLMPPHMLKRDYVDGQTDLDTLARVYDVSAQALYIQLNSLGLIT